MTNLFANPADNTLPGTFIARKQFSDNYWTIWHVGAGIGLLGGTFILFCAAFLTIFQFFYRETPHGNWLFAVVLPLWIIGAHCFDKVDHLEKARRIEYCRRQGMSEEKCASRQLPDETFK